MPHEDRPFTCAVPIATLLCVGLPLLGASCTRGCRHGTCPGAAAARRWLTCFLFLNTPITGPNHSRFKRWLARHGPFDLVIDGANIALYGPLYRGLAAQPKQARGPWLARGARLARGSGLRWPGVAQPPWPPPRLAKRAPEEKARLNPRSARPRGPRPVARLLAAAAGPRRAPRHPTPKQIRAVWDYAREAFPGRRALVVVHQSKDRAFRGVARRSPRGAPAAAASPGGPAPDGAADPEVADWLDGLIAAKQYYVTGHRTNDDWYWLYACIAAQVGARMGGTAGRGRAVRQGFGRLGGTPGRAASPLIAGRSGARPLPSGMGRPVTPPWFGRAGQPSAPPPRPATRRGRTRAPDPPGQGPPDQQRQAAGPHVRGQSAPVWALEAAASGAVLPNPGRGGRPGPAPAVHGVRAAAARQRRVDAAGGGPGGVADGRAQAVTRAGRLRHAPAGGGRGSPPLCSKPGPCVPAPDPRLGPL